MKRPTIITADTTGMVPLVPMGFDCPPPLNYSIAPPPLSAPFTTWIILSGLYPHPQSITC